MNFINSLIANFIIIDERFWVAISFVIFCLAATPLFKKLFLKKLDERIDEIKKIINNATQLNQNTTAKLKQLEDEIIEVKKNAELIIQNANKKSQEIIAENSKKASNLAIEIRNSNNIKLENIKTNYTMQIYHQVLSIVFANIAGEVAKNPAAFDNINSLQNIDFSKLNLQK